MNVKDSWKDLELIKKVQCGKNNQNLITLLKDSNNYKQKNKRKEKEI